MSTPAISVAMSVFNGEGFLAQSIESVLGQTFGDFEFLILDDGSSDATPDILRAYARKDHRIRPIIRENRGLIASLNELIRESRASVIARMDDDDISMPERFARQFAFLESNPGHGVVGSWSQDIDIGGAPLRVAGCDHPVTHEAILETIERGGQLICHPSAMYRKDVVESVGGYHAAFRHCEDLDLWLRLASVTRLANIPERLVQYRRSPDQVSCRHATEQQTGTVIAYLAYAERKAGRPDPTQDLDELPPIDDLDALFDRPGISSMVREKVALSLRYSPDALRDHGFDLLMRHLREGGKRDGMWRTVARLLRFGEPGRAIKLAATLAATA